MSRLFALAVFVFLALSLRSAHATEADMFCATTTTSTGAYAWVPCVGTSVFSEIVPNNTTSVAVKTSAGQIYAIHAANNSTTLAYIKIYNAAQGDTTCGSGTPVARFMIPASATALVFSDLNGISLGTAITLCVTTGIADNDTGAPTASEYIVDIDYK